MKEINLFNAGTLVNLSIGTWSGRKMVTYKDMEAMGIDVEKLPQEIVNFGRKLLVPKSELQKIKTLEQKARVALAHASVPFGVVNGHFVPMGMVGVIDDKLTALKTTFFEAVDSFINRFEDMKNTVKTKICANFPAFWTNCLRNYYPSDPQILRRKFYFDWQMFQIQAQGEFNETSAEKIKMQREALQNQVQQFADEYVVAMRQETVKFCELMTARVNGKAYGEEDAPKKLTPRSLAYFKKYVDKFKNMNIFGDDSIDKLLQEFREQFMDAHTTPKDLDNQNVKNSITEALASIRKTASLQDEETGSLGILKRKVVI